MSYLLDTDVFSVAARDNCEPLRERLGQVPWRDLALSAITAGEIEFGLARHRPTARVFERLQLLRATIQVMDLNDSVAREYGRLRHLLAQAGTPIGPNDVWIAAHALTEKRTLVTGNEREFRRVPGLLVENWMR